MTMKPLPLTWQITVQREHIPGFPESGYVQIDMLDTDGENHGSTSRNKLRHQGYDIPDLSHLPTGKYTVGEIVGQSQLAHDRLVASHAQLRELLERVNRLTKHRCNRGAYLTPDEVKAMDDTNAALLETRKVFGQPANKA